MKLDIQKSLDQIRRHIDAGQLDQAEQLCGQILSLDPKNPAALHQMGKLAHFGRRPDIAVDLFKQSMALQPKNVDAQLDLVAALVSLNRIDDAMSAVQGAIAAAPQTARAHYMLGTILIGTGRTNQGIAALRQALILKPDYAEAHNNLGNALVIKGMLLDALDQFRKYQSLRPESAEANRNLGSVLAATGEFHAAIASLQKALALQPVDAYSHSLLAGAFKGLGDIAQAIAHSDRAIAIEPGNLRASSSRLHILHFSPAFDPPRILQEHRRWDQLWISGLATEPPQRLRSPDRRLRVGYLSPDFREHSVAYFFEGLLAHHDPQQIESFCYADIVRPDAFTARIQQNAHHWRDITQQSDEQVAQAIRADHIDILVDLAGHTGGGRPLIPARKPAPIQVNYLGYPHTSGMNCIDYRLTDAHIDPPGMTERFHSEELLRLPHTFACYRPPDFAPLVAPLPALSKGYLTFGSFTVMAKINPSLLQTWASLLKLTPKSRLKLVASGLHQPEVQKPIIAAFEQNGVSRDRFDLSGLTSMEEYLAAHHQVDILLDTFPVNGHTITCHALWMGVPAICLAGTCSYQRFGASVLHNVGLEEFVANDPQSYADIAVQLAGDLPRLAHLRATMRERMTGSPLLDAARLARHVEDAYRRMWLKWCEAR